MIAHHQRHTSVGPSENDLHRAYDAFWVGVHDSVADDRAIAPLFLTATVPCRPVIPPADRAWWSTDDDNLAMVADGYGPGATG